MLIRRMVSKGYTFSAHFDTILLPPLSADGNASVFGGGRQGGRGGKALASLPFCRVAERTVKQNGITCYTKMIWSCSRRHIVV